jgi:serine phosphatase RsbU (regulator of sigma subunit)
MLPHLSAIKKSFPESFILYEPRDIVSGDFYWFTETNLEPRYTKEPTLKNTPSIFRGFAEGKKIIAAVDCTGHGVPGAFMSMVGDAYLNQIINSEVITQPQLILKELDNYVRNGLKQKETSNLDGMDMTICVIDPNLKTLSFAGAKNPLIYIQDGNLHQIRGDKLGIGGFIFDESPKEFTRHVISIDKPTWFYIFSDGYQDQFGGKKGKKFMIRNLKELLLDNHQKPMEEQSLLLKEALIDWMQGYKQVDDILVIGAYLDPEKL